MEPLQLTGLTAIRFPASIPDVITSVTAAADLNMASSQWLYQFGGTIAGVGVAAVVGAFTVTHYIRNWARPQLVYSVSSPMAIRTAPTRYAGKQKIYRTFCVLKNAGRQAITMEMFSGQEPITLDLGVPVEDTSVETLPEEMPTPDVPAIDGTSVRIGPLTLAPGQVVTVSIFTSGRPTQADVKAPLPQVRLRKRPI
jgi:hypothetical protein